MPVNNSLQEIITSWLLKNGFVQPHFILLSDFYLLYPKYSKYFPVKNDCLVCVSALPYPQGEPPIDVSVPQGLIAPFAAAHYYKEAVLRLKKLRTELSALDLVSKPESIRIFCNSRFPEKDLAFASGLGIYGKNDLILIPGFGSLFVIAGFLLSDYSTCKNDKFIPSKKKDFSLCSKCNACLKACPVQAFSKPGKLNHKRCLQAWMSKPGYLLPWVMGAMGMRVYGCQTCQDVCPWNRDVPSVSPSSIGRLGSTVSLKWLLTMDDAELKLNLRSSALGLSWLSPQTIMRNSIIAAGNSHDPQLIPELLKKQSHPIDWIKKTVSWSIQQIKKHAENHKKYSQ